MTPTWAVQSAPPPVQFEVGPKVRKAGWVKTPSSASLAPVTSSWVPAGCAGSVVALAKHQTVRFTSSPPPRQEKATSCPNDGVLGSMTIAAAGAASTVPAAAPTLASRASASGTDGRVMGASDRVDGRL